MTIFFADMLGLFDGPPHLDLAGRVARRPNRNRAQSNKSDPKLRLAKPMVGIGIDGTVMGPGLEDFPESSISYG